jgi:hypothetical protein
MEIVELLGVALGLASLAGINLYLTVLLAGLAVRFDWLQVAAQHPSLDALGHPIVLVVAGLLFCLEFMADKIPWVDSLWDSVHTAIRPVGGVLLGLQVVGDLPTYIQVLTALMAGGAALTTHAAKAGTRLVINHSPEPASNIGMSLAEDVVVAGGVALSLLHPVAALGSFAGLLLILWLIFPKLWRAMKTTAWLVLKKLRMPGTDRTGERTVELERRMNDELRDLLLLQVGVNELDVKATVPCISGKSRGVRGLSPNLECLLVLTDGSEALYCAASKGLSDRVFRLPLAEANLRMESTFLSENFVLESPSQRAVFRFPRGQERTIDAIMTRLRPVPDRDSPEPGPAPHTESAPAPAPLFVPEPAKRLELTKPVPVPAPEAVPAPVSSEGGKGKESGGVHEINRDPASPQSEPAENLPAPAVLKRLAPRVTPRRDAESAVVLRTTPEEASVEPSADGPSGTDADKSPVASSPNSTPAPEAKATEEVPEPQSPDAPVLAPALDSASDPTNEAAPAADSEERKTLPPFPSIP